jgi:hypothetical protein
VLLSACGSSSSSSSTAPPTLGGRLDTKRVEHAIEQSIEAERHLKATVVCPRSVPQMKGRTFTCVATAKEGKRILRTTFTVYQRNNAGGVYYASPK